MSLILGRGVDPELIKVYFCGKHHCWHVGSIPANAKPGRPWVDRGVA
jgi:hypothetical protein